MKTTKIIVTTKDNGTYEEMCYSLMATADRLDEIFSCDNVCGVEAMDPHTGEILCLFHLYPTEKRYVSETFALDLAKEILN